MGRKKISRRGFLAGAGVALAAGMAGCAPSSDVGAKGHADAQLTMDGLNPVKEHETDLVIVGCGTSDLAAAAEAGQEGVNCIVIDKAASYGGNAPAVEACFAVGDRLAAEQGVAYTVADVILRELEYSNYRTDGVMWTDLVSSSEDNYYWLVDSGVRFSGRVEKGSGLIPVAHVFEVDPGDGLAAYATPLYQLAEKLGVQFAFSQTAFRLMRDERGVVCGVYTTNAEGDVELFKSKAVILASGGFANNHELLARADWAGKADDFLINAMQINDGDGYKMAVEAGAGDTVPHSCSINTAYIYSLGDKKAPGRTVSTDPSVLWINEDAVRFVNEDFATKTNRQAITNPLRNQKEHYAFFDRGTAESILSPTEGFIEKFDEVLASKPDDLFVGETVEEVAEEAGLNPDALVQTVRRYNENAMQGKDAEYNKEASYLKVMEKGPYYIGRLSLSTCATFGGIRTNRKFEVVTDASEAVPGLYAIGTDGCMLYRDTYTICVPTSACAHHVHSGRQSVMNAMAYMESI